MAKLVPIAITAIAAATPASVDARSLSDIEQAIADRRAAQSRPAHVGPGQLSLDTKSASASECETRDGAEIVVCAPKKKVYGPDPAVLAAEPRPIASAPDSRVTVNQSCVGPNCHGGGVIPVTAIALKAATALVKAIQGDDWKSVFKTGPDEYERYLAAKKKRAAVTQ